MGSGGGVKGGCSCSSRNSRCKKKNMHRVSQPPRRGLLIPCVFPSPTTAWGCLRSSLPLGTGWGSPASCYPGRPSAIFVPPRILPRFRHNGTFWRSFVQVLACCRFDPKCKLIFFFFWFFFSFVKHNICFHSPAALRSHPVSCSRGSLQLHFEFALSTFPF